MSKTKSQYKCNNCNNIFTKWSGQCPSCNSWDTIIEHKSEIKIANFNKENFSTTESDIAATILTESNQNPLRINSGINEFDRLLGGGIVAGSVLLIGGDPGIGKSTLILQILNSIAQQNIDSLYFSGEESKEQIQLRAQRLNITKSNIHISTITEVVTISNFLRKNPEIKFVVIDSIQTTYVKDLGQTQGSIAQLRNSTLEFSDLAKNLGITFILIGHVTKEGQIAGPKLVEHMVDTVLYFESEKNSNFRILRSHKNRYGATNELAIFEMMQNGLNQVSNPSEIFLQEYNENVSGTAIFPLVEGSRTILLELQALVANSYMATPRRTVVGWDQNRLAIILAVLSSRLKLNFNQLEVYFSVAGGLKISDPAADLAVCAALISALQNKALAKKTIFFGEIGLSGEVRNVKNPEARIKEAKKLGFKRAITPAFKKNIKSLDMEIKTVSHISELLDFINSSLTNIRDDA